jgi:hypothetical protein
VILLPSGRGMQRRIKVETGATVLIYGGQAANRLAGALIWPFATGVAQRIFQGGMAVVTKAEDKTERIGLPGQEKDQQTEDRNGLSGGLRLHTSSR